MKYFQGCFSHTAYFHRSLRGSLSRGRSGKRKNGEIDSSSASSWLIPFLWGGMLEVGSTWPVSLEGALQSITLHPLRASLLLAELLIQLGPYQ